MHVFAVPSDKVTPFLTLPEKDCQPCRSVGWLVGRSVGLAGSVSW